ncbi:hypothetical protein DJ021_09170 [Phenylobacterium hankyongense]|uniref:Uncharacterized protein n=1 Tax=Phenylobacterium hankyongense TaxID=1813876 RepID=A0A328B0J2_9CAUL|nr:tetratricopeptide repeat-containing glycosyltransferase family protein [Phenylobacterium hankyongense]RAK59961.1 hypothetical protein DJ021_09170 [Phenylobacterium hankyongense]
MISSEGWDANLAKALLDRAADAHRVGDLAAAERGYLALGAMPAALHNLGVLYAATARFDEAERSLRGALALEPDFAPAQHALALELLAQGRYAEGWPLYEARRRIPGLRTPNPQMRIAEWRGENLAGKRLIVWAEQGFGDQLQFARFFRSLPSDCEVLFVCPPELAPLFPGCIVGQGRVELPMADYWTLICSLPLHLGVTVETLPPPAPLPVKRRSGGGVGVMGRGRPTHANDAHRSLPADLAAWLLELGQDLSPEATGARTFADTAATVAGLDLVISVDTSVAHLAGCLGTPAWVLLPAVDTDWRWLRGRDDSPWYPGMRLFRQESSGDWAPVVRRVRDAVDDVRRAVG